MNYENQPLTAQAARELQNMDLETKLVFTDAKMWEWENFTEGNWYVSFSGGKDSSVLLYLACLFLNRYREVPHPLHVLFCDTGLEYPEIRRFVSWYIDWLREKFPRLTIDYQRRRPKKDFMSVVSEYGYPIVGKEVSQRIYEARQKPGGAQDRKLHGTYGSEKDNSAFYKYGKESSWLFLMDKPIKISHLCCNHTKKEPAHTYERNETRFSMTGQMADEGALRWSQWLKSGCNAFEGTKAKSNPMSFWKEQDVLTYALAENIPLCSVYGNILHYDGENFYEDSLCNAPLKCTGCQRTGCVFCGFGAHLEKGNDRRFVRLKETHPIHWNFAINGGEWDAKDGLWKPSKTLGHVGMGMGRVLDYIGVEY